MPTGSARSLPLAELPPQTKPLDMVDSPAPDSPDAFEAFLSALPNIPAHEDRTKRKRGVGDTAKSLDADRDRARGSGGANSTSDLPITEPPQASANTEDLPMQVNPAFEQSGKQPDEPSDMED